MNEATRWRASLGREIASAYARDPNVAAVALGGSVARGWADRHSDIELFVFWTAPPSDASRVDAVTRAGGRIDIWWSNPPAPADYQRIFDASNGRIGQMWPYEDEEWSEHFYVRGVDIGVSGFLCATADQYLVDVVEGCDTTERKHILLAAIVSGVPLTGAEQFEAWQARAAAYPAELARAVVAEQLALEDDDWWECEKMVERDERYLLYPLLSQTSNVVGRLLLALNRRYLPDPRLKWLDRLVAPLEIAPVDLGPRLKALYRLEPADAIATLQQLIEETLDLVDSQLGDVDTSFARRWYRHRRAQWDQAPRETNQV